MATGADAAPSIPRITVEARAADPAGFWSLRSLAIASAQEANGKVWTDYNLHDPGVTLLEVLCYALTDIAFQADFDVADHLRGPDGVINGRRQALAAPDEIFPSRANTEADYRRVLFDQVPGLQDARLSSDVGGGLLHLSLLPSDRNEHPWDAMQARALEAYHAQRGLGEDLDETVARIEVRLCALALDAEIEGARDPSDVVADIYDVSADFLAPRPPIHGLTELRQQGRSLEQIFTGPAMQFGYINEEDLRGRVPGEIDPEPGQSDEVWLSDLRNKLLDIPGVAGVTRLTMCLDGEEPCTRALTWSGEVWAPRLRSPRLRGPNGVMPPDAADVAMVRLSRRGTPVAISAVEVAARYADIRAGRRHGAPSPNDGSDRFDLPRTAALTREPYASAGALLPPIYGLYDPDPGSVRDPRTTQLRSYLALMDQVLANGGAQVRNLRDLFSLDQDLDRSYWVEVLDNRAAPGIEALYGARTRDQIRDEVFDAYDDAIDRRHRVLDYLLALYGETLAQNTMRQFLDYLDSVELAQALLRNKVDYLRRIVRLSRDRAEGIHCGAGLWSARSPTPASMRRISLLLGFHNTKARRLADPLLDPGWALGATVPSGWTGTPPDEDNDDLGEPSPLPWPADRRPVLTDDAARRMLEGCRIDGDVLFALAVDRRRYGWRPQKRGARGRLALGPDGQGRWWDLGEFKTRREAARAAVKLRKTMLDLTDACEGVHLVEHILLRPRAAPAATELLALRVTLVFPGWTARTAPTPRPAFRPFAEETARINLPAHVTLQCLWLEPAAMAQFEDAYGMWLDRLQAHCSGRGSVAELDDAALAVLKLIQPPPTPAPPGEG